MRANELLAAGDRNLAHVLRLIARTSPGGFVQDDGRLLLVSSSRTWPGPYTNGALRLDPSLPAESVLAAAAAFFARHSPGYCVWVAAHADADLEEAALARGLLQISATGSPRMVLDHRLPSSQPRRGVHLSEVVDDDGRRDYLEVVLGAYPPGELPPDVAVSQLSSIQSVRGPGLRAVVARLEGRPASAAMVVVSDGVAGIQLVGTIPDARGRGLGGLCTTWAVNRGFRLGATAAVLEASEMGAPLYRRLGFVERSHYRWCFGPPRA